MLLRDSWFLKFLSWGFAVWAVLFGATVAAVGETLTSPQWQLLMSIPGHRWSWGIGFVAAGLFTIYGNVRKHNLIIALGHFWHGSLSILIAGFYVIGPWLGPNLITLGYWPWFVPALLGWLLAAVFGSPIKA